MKRHYAKECRANIEVITPNTAQCKICGQTYRRTNYYGKQGWKMREDDDSLIQYIRQNESNFTRPVLSGG